MRAGGNSEPNFENYALFQEKPPGTGRGVHARSRRANRDVDVEPERRRQCQSGVSFSGEV